MTLTEITDQTEWDAFVNGHECGHPLQLWAWGEVKRENGWRPVRLRSGDVGAQVLIWPIPKTGKYVAYAPRGPLAMPSSKDGINLLKQLSDYARKNSALYLRIEPSWITADMPADWVAAKDRILLSETYTIDLTKSESEIESAMRSKTRQYIRKAAGEGVTIKKLDGDSDLADFWRIYKSTAERAGFGLHALDYYRRILKEFRDSSCMMVAEVEGQAEAFLWLVSGGSVAFELYGGVTEVGASHHANYLLKWEAIKAMKTAECKVYDFNGRLHEGVSQFKAGFGPDETDFVGTYDRPFNKLGYLAWVSLLPTLKPIGRKLLKRRVVK